MLWTLEWGEKSVPKLVLSARSSSCQDKAMWTLKWGAKSDPVLGPPNCFFFSRPPKRCPDFRPHFEVHIAHLFLQPDAEKFHPRVGCLWVGSFPSHHIAGTGILLRALVFGTLFWPHFGAQDNGFIQERGVVVVAGTRVGVVIVIPVFLAALVAVFLVVLVLFWALSWLQFCAWTRVGFLRGRLVSFFVAVLVGLFVAFLVAVLVFAFV